jgi:hypothetical protein
MCWGPYPPVDVPPIISKYSHGRVPLTMTLWSSRALIIFWRIKSDDKPRIPPPSTKVSITMAWHLEVIYLVIEAEVDVSFRENVYAVKDTSPCVQLSCLPNQDQMRFLPMYKTRHEIFLLHKESIPIFKFSPCQTWSIVENLHYQS